ncbi:hypothetical protein YC2023_084862 [Brassica napus]
MRDSIDVSSHNSDVYGASCSSDESNAPTTKDIEAEMRRLNHLLYVSSCCSVLWSIGSSGRDEVIRVLWSSVVLW